MGRAGYRRPVTTTTPPTTDLRLVVGCDGSPPAERALNAAANLLQGRTGRIYVVYVAHMSSMAGLSPTAVSELETDFDEIEQELSFAPRSASSCAAAWRAGTSSGARA